MELIGHVEKADVILAIDSDLLSSTPGWVRYGHDYSSPRNPARTETMSRLYIVEPTPDFSHLTAAPGL